VESAIKKYANVDVRWSMQGMLRLMPEGMVRLFQPTIDNIKNAIDRVINESTISGSCFKWLMLLYF